MARLNVYLFVAVVLCQTVSVFSRQFDFGDLDINNVNTPAAPGSQVPTTSTTPSPEFTRCVSACPRLPQYNPVCGTNGVSYANDYALRCAQNCGLNVQELHVGTCGRSVGGK